MNGDTVYVKLSMLWTKQKEISVVVSYLDYFEHNDYSYIHFCLNSNTVDVNGIFFVVLRALTFYIIIVLVDYPDEW